jgi:DNA-binding MarR family transcriptional regulator
VLLLMIKGASDGSERSTVGALVERLQLSQSTVTELVQRAEAAGLLDREPSAEDGRVVHLGLTARGEGLLEAAAAQHGAERRLLAQVVASVAAAADG